jgi:hypothetical protein
MLAVWATAALFTFGGASCPLPDARAGTELNLDSIKGFVVTEGEELLTRFAPVILVEEYEQTYNRVGAPSARLDEDGDEDVYVDPARPVYYTQVQEWQTEKGKYTNLIYRAHFEMSLGNPKSTNGGKGYNVGLMTVVTIDENQHPVLVNVVHTCGCFHAILPTTFLSKDAYPDGWDVESYATYGETLPGLVKYPEGFDKDVRPVLYLRGGSHRAVDIQLASIDSVREKYELFNAALEPESALEHLKLGDGETSFYFTDGKNKGLVKGAIKKKESLLLGAIIGDTRVGQDRKFGSEEEVPRGFYTTINPAKKDESDMWDYAKFLRTNGWKL